MSESPTQLPYTLSPDDKSVGVMAYTQTSLFWGDVVVKNMIRVNTWLRTNTVPEIICLYNAKSLSIMAASQPKVLPFRELYIQTAQILAYHLRPPAVEPLDFDPTEPNRKMEPVSVLIGQFRFNGAVRISSRTPLATYLDISRESFSPLYEVEITCPSVPTLTPIRVNYVLIRLKSAVFGVNNQSRS